MFERYTEKARRVIYFARYEASNIGSPYIWVSISRPKICCSVYCANTSVLQRRYCRSEDCGPRLFARKLERMQHENARRRELSGVAENAHNATQLSMDQTIAADFLNVSCRRLGQMTEYLTTCVGKLTDEQIWRRQGAYENAVGNLVLHLCGNARQWIMHGIGGAPDVRVRAAEFSADGGMSGAELITLFDATMAEAKAVIAAVPAERMVERITPQGRDVSVLEAIYQVVGHVQQHVGQIILVTKQMLETDLDLTMPRPR